jgi:methionyl-tRNA formyltransferase
MARWAVSVFIGLKMRIIFMGTPQFAVVSLQKLISSGLDIISVVTAPDKPVGRGLKLLASPVKKEALNSDIPILQPDNLKDPAFLAAIDQLEPDLMIIVAFRILPEILFTKARLGAVNLHGSLLPKYRGAAPINWALINGETETGVTTFFLKQKVDTGNIIAQEKIQISSSLTAGELHDIMAETGADLLLKTITLIKNGNATTTRQSEAEVSKAPKIFPQDCVINFDQPVHNVHNFIRGLSPKPGAYTYYIKKRMQLFDSEILDTESKQKVSGSLTITEKSDKFIIQCNPGKLIVGELKLEGKKRMPVADFLRGHSIKPGTIFGSIQ